MRAQCVEFVEEIHALGLTNRFEDEAQLRGGLAHELRDQTFEHDREQRQMQFAGERRGCHRFPGAGRPEKEKLAARTQAVFAEPLLLPLFEKHALQPLGQSLGQRHVAEANGGRLDREQTREFTARLKNHQLPGPASDRRRSPFRFIDQIA